MEVGCSFYSKSTGSRDLLQWEIGLEQQQQRRIFVLKVQVAT